MKPLTAKDVRNMMRRDSLERARKRKYPEATRARLQLIDHFIQELLVGDSNLSGYDLQQLTGMHMRLCQMDAYVYTFTDENRRALHELMREKGLQKTH